MSAAKSEKDPLMFRITLTELERLIDIRGNLRLDSRTLSLDNTITKGISCKLDLLSDYDVNTSESKAFEELERLVNMKCKLSEQYRGPQTHHKVIDTTIDEMIGIKVNFIKKDAFSEISSEDRVEPMTALERLTAVKIKFQSIEVDDLVTKELDYLLSTEIEDLLCFKIRDVVWKTRTKAQPRFLILHDEFTNSL